MNLPLEATIFLIACLLMLSILTSKVAVRIGIPALVLFLFIGMGLGSEGLGGIEFDFPELTQSVGIVALIFILFSGGLDTDFDSVRKVMSEGLLLSTLGVLLTAIIVGVFAQLALGFSLEQGILLGATMAATDAAAVFSVLRGKAVRLAGPLKPILEFESGSNDPMAVFLTLGMIQLITHPQQSALSLIPLFLTQMIVGGIIGVGSSYLMRYVINRIRLEYDGLYPVLSIAFVLSIYGLTTVLNGNGFLAIYLAGLLLGRHDFIHKSSLGNFHDGLAWLMQIAMFLVLGLQVFPSRLVNIAPEGMLTAAVLILIARPLSVFLLTIPTRLTTKEKGFISWVGLRGAAPIILATFTQLSDFELPLPIFELVFFVVLVSVTLQGTTITRVAKHLNLLASSAHTPPAAEQAPKSRTRLRDYLVNLRTTSDSAVVGKQILDIHLPEDTLIIAIKRTAQIIVPRGSTIIKPNDELLILTPPQHHERTRRLFTQSDSSESSGAI